MRDEVHALPEIKNQSAAAEALMKPKSNKVREREKEENVMGISLTSITFFEVRFFPVVIVYLSYCCFR